jgi:hypothetical protein
MAIVQAVLAAVLRSAGKILNMAFGWATTMLFGKVPQDRQTYLSVIAFGSIAWIVVLLGIIFPAVGTFLLAFIPLPDWVGDTWVRLAMLAAAVIIPIVVGVVSVLMLDPQDRPAGIAGKAKAVLKGYPYTLGLAITLILMTILAPVMKARAMLKRWTTRHVPVVVEANDYHEVVGAVERALATGGLKTRREPASWMLRLPTKVLTLLAGGAIENLVADELTTLKSDRAEVLLHPSDLVISGRELDAARANAIITEHLTFTRAYMTWTKEANALEDRLRRIWCGLRERSDGADDTRATEQLAAVEGELRTTELSYEEWEVLFREKLLVERGLLQVKAGLADQPADLTEVRPEQGGAAKAARNGKAGAGASGSRLAYLPLAAAGAAVAFFVWRGVAGDKPRRTW